MCGHTLAGVAGHAKCKERSAQSKGKEVGLADEERCLRLRACAVSRQCTFTGKKANNGYAVTFSHKRNKKLQQPNLQVGLLASQRQAWPRDAATHGLV